MSRAQHDDDIRYLPVVIGDDVVMTVPEGQARQVAANDLPPAEPLWFDIALGAFVLFCLWRIVFGGGPS